MTQWVTKIESAAASLLILAVRDNVYLYAVDYGGAQWQVAIALVADLPARKVPGLWTQRLRGLDQGTESLTF